MAEGDALHYNDFKEQLYSAKHNLVNAGHALNVTLHTSYTPDIDAHQVRADVVGTEYGTADNYTAGGKTLANQAVAQDNGNDRATLDFDDAVWTSLGALSPATPSDAIIWNDGQTSPVDPLIGYIELGTTATDGNDYTLQWAAPAMTLT